MRPGKKIASCFSTFYACLVQAFHSLGYHLESNFERQPLRLRVDFARFKRHLKKLTIAMFMKTNDVIYEYPQLKRLHAATLLPLFASRTHE